MKPLFAIALATFGFALPLAAQQPDKTIAHLKDVNGNVLVSRESGLAAGGNAVPLAKGMRVITTANSEAVVVFDNGCEVRLKPNQRFEVAIDKPCAALIASVESILPEVSTGAIGLLVPAIDPIVVGTYGLISDRQNSKVSPN